MAYYLRSSLLFSRSGSKTGEPNGGSRKKMLLRWEEKINSRTTKLSCSADHLRPRVRQTFPQSLQSIPHLPILPWNKIKKVGLKLDFLNKYTEIDQRIIVMSKVFLTMRTKCKHSANENFVTSGSDSQFAVSNSFTICCQILRVWHIRSLENCRKD